MTNPMIPAQAVEAAYEHLGADDTGFRYVNKARIRGLLEAAAPHIRAQALDDAALDIRHWSHVFETLRARAADERTRK